MSRTGAISVVGSIGWITVQIGGSALMFDRASPSPHDFISLEQIATVN